MAVVIVNIVVLAVIVFFVGDGFVFVVVVVVGVLSFSFSLYVGWIRWFYFISSYKEHSLRAFQRCASNSRPKALCMLLDLYIWRSGEVWKKEGVMEWMERNVRQVVNGWESFKDTAEYYKKL